MGGRKRRQGWLSAPGRWQGTLGRACEEAKDTHLLDLGCRRPSGPFRVYCNLQLHVKSGWRARKEPAKVLLGNMAGEAVGGRSRSGGREDASEGGNVVSAYLVGSYFQLFIFPLSRKSHFLVFFFFF